MLYLFPKNCELFLALYKYDIKAINLVAYRIHSKAQQEATLSTEDKKLH